MDRRSRHDLERELGYGITDSWDEIVETLQGAPVSTNTELGGYVTGTTSTWYKLQRLEKLHAARSQGRHPVNFTAAYTDMDNDAVITGIGDHTTGIGDSTTGIGYCTIGTTGTRWRSYTARAARGAGQHRSQQPQPQQQPPPPTATTTTSVTNTQLQAMIDQGVTAALATRDANRNGDDSHTSGTGGRRTERVVQECTYQDFMKCKPLYFKGTEGVVELTQWFERIETVFRISNCAVENQVNHDAAYAMTWADLRKKMTDKYCPRNEMKKLKAELWNLKVKESDKIERYVGGLPDMIHGNIVASKPKTMQEDVETATELMDKKGYFRRECPKLKNNKNSGNQVGNDKAPAKVYMVGHAGTNPDSNIVTGMFLLNNRYASILFDTGADRSFVSTAFSSQMDITPSTLDHYYDVKLAD
ncbi:reverse transcriptase domain-containing protein [Tanacetum coccineum]